MKCVHMCLSEDSYGSRFFPSTIKILGIGTWVLRGPLTKTLTLPAHLAIFMKLPQLLLVNLHPPTTTFCSETCSFFSTLFKRLL